MSTVHPDYRMGSIYEESRMRGDAAQKRGWDKDRRQGKTKCKEKDGIKEKNERHTFG